MNRSENERTNITIFFFRSYAPRYPNNSHNTYMYSNEWSERRENQLAAHLKENNFLPICISDNESDQTALFVGGMCSNVWARDHIILITWIRVYSAIRCASRNASWSIIIELFYRFDSNRRVVRAEEKFCDSIEIETYWPNTGDKGESDAHCYMFIAMRWLRRRIFSSLSARPSTYGRTTANSII